MNEKIFLWPGQAPYSEYSPEQAQPSLVPYEAGNTSGAIVVLAGGTTEWDFDELSGNTRNLVSRSGSARGTFGEHILVKITSRPVEFINCQRRNDDPRCDVIEPGVAFTPAYTFIHHSLLIASLRQLVGMKCVSDILRLQDLETQQLIRRSHGQRPVLFCCQLRHAPT